MFGKATVPMRDLNKVNRIISTRIMTVCVTVRMGVICSYLALIYIALQLKHPKFFKRFWKSKPCFSADPEQGKIYLRNSVDLSCLWVVWLTPWTNCGTSVITCDAKNHLIFRENRSDIFWRNTSFIENTSFFRTYYLFAQRTRDAKQEISCIRPYW